MVRNPRPLSQSHFPHSPGLPRGSTAAAGHPVGLHGSDDVCCGRNKGKHIEFRADKVTWGDTHCARLSDREKALLQ